MKKLLIFISLLTIISLSTSCSNGISKSKEDCLNKKSSYSRCCYNKDNNTCFSLGSNNINDYYKLLKQKNTNNIDCGFTATDEINYCKRIVPYPSSNVTSCTEYNMIIPDVINITTGETRSYRCCMNNDEYFNHKCNYNLIGETDYEIEILKRGIISGNFYYCKDNNYNDTFLQYAYSDNIGPNKCSQNKISNKDAYYYEGYKYDRCCYVSYGNEQICAPFPSNDNFIENFINKKKQEGLSSYMIKCNTNSNENHFNYKVNSDLEISVFECENINPESIGDCTDYTIIPYEIKTISGYTYDKCCFYEVGNGNNSCVVLPNDEKFLRDLKEKSKYNGNNKINLIDCNSNYMMINIIILLINIFMLN